MAKSATCKGKIRKVIKANELTDPRIKKTTVQSKVEGLTVGELPSTQNGQKYSSSSPCSVVLLPRDEAAELVWRSDGLTADAVWSVVARQSRRGETERGQRRPRQKAKVFGSDWLDMEEALMEGGKILLSIWNIGLI
nr:hypothetical protein Itr_chr13CG17430 [Ipomoea trifida]